MWETGAELTAPCQGRHEGSEEDLFCTTCVHLRDTYLEQGGFCKVLDDTQLSAAPRVAAARGAHRAGG